jgi:hypothetical protein
MVTETPDLSRPRLHQAAPIRVRTTACLNFWRVTSAPILSKKTRAYPLREAHPRTKIWKGRVPMPTNLQRTRTHGHFRQPRMLQPPLIPSPGRHLDCRPRVSMSSNSRINRPLIFLHRLNYVASLSRQAMPRSSHPRANSEEARSQAFSRVRWPRCQGLCPRWVPRSNRLWYPQGSRVLQSRLSGRTL